MKAPAAVEVPMRMVGAPDERRVDHRVDVVEAVFENSVALVIGFRALAVWPAIAPPVEGPVPSLTAENPREARVVASGGPAL
ncbi:hypothetical protein [Pseudofrankia inefficax]|uniref:hypothetical protein n=1 Tax=Pseudofrankia inefficax (strain DSM 45817 / CECT 9037 / DDB 130130 / EuI1c) TaxID=298654 RepID=UPI0012FE654F|nr:hypothetical protein [Pseudofrankia inefficax]